MARILQKDSASLPHDVQKSISLLLGVSMIILALTMIPVVRANDLTIDLNPAQGPVGTGVSIYGLGFASGQVSITFNSKDVSKTSTGMFGRINAVFIVPNVSPGTYTVVAKDSAGNQATGTFTVTLKASTTASASSTSYPTISLSVTQGRPSMTLSITGSGFSSGGPVTINFGTTYVKEVTAESTGRITASFSVPNVSPGAYLVSASGVGGKYAAATFAVTQSSAAGTGLNPTSSPEIANNTFWSTPTIAVFIIAIAAASIVSLMLMYRRRGEHKTLFEEETPSYKPLPSTPLSASSTKSKYDQFSTSRYNQPIIRSSVQPSKPVLSPAYAKNKSYNQQEVNTMPCPHCKHMVKNYYSVCPFCRKRLR